MGGIIICTFKSGHTLAEVARGVGIVEPLRKVLPDTLGQVPGHLQQKM